MNRRTLTLYGLLPLAALLAAAPATDRSWRRALLEQRAAKDSEFRTSPTSPMAGIARLAVPAPGPRVLAAHARGVDVVAPDPDGMPHDKHGYSRTLALRDGRWVFAGEPGDDEAVSPGAPVSLGRYTLVCYPAADALTVLVFDPQRPMLLHFRGLRYFPPTRGWVLPARLERLPDPKAVSMLTTRNLQKTFFRYARVHFRRAGRDMTLTAFKSALQGDEGTTLFIPFKDGSNGRSTYEVGRFLEVPEPSGTDFMLDFNAAFNPLCNYSPAYNCPVPPLENFLDVEVPAGERVYPHEEEKARGG